MGEHFREISERVVIPASGAAALLLHSEEGDCLVVLNVLEPDDTTFRPAIVTFERCLQSVFGYPNDEALSGDPRAEPGAAPHYGFFEVIESTWPARLIAYNERRFPGRTPPHYQEARHYFIGSHDASGEFLARAMKVELPEGTYADAVHEALHRV